jgi:FkbH-like protein
MLSDRQGVREVVEQIKCVILDLDNVLWSGYCHDGPEAVELKRDVLSAARKLASRGIILAAASKNAEEDGRLALEAFGLASMFTTVRICWTPKSSSIREILEELSFFPANLAFVDDSAFERAEVLHGLPEATVLSPTEFLSAVHLTRFTRQSRTLVDVMRPKLMATDADRRRAKEASGATYQEFLASIDTRVYLKRPNRSEFERIYSLQFRSHRLNFSRRQYSREELTEVLYDLPGGSASNFSSWVLRVDDLFGSLGLCGFIAVDTSQADAWRLTDFVLSCRAQKRMIEQAVFGFLHQEASKAGKRVLEGIFVETRENAHLRQVYIEAGFRLVACNDRESLFSLDLADRSLDVPSCLTLEYVLRDENWELGGIPFVRDYVYRFLQGTSPPRRVLSLGAGWDDVMGDGWRDMRRSEWPDSLAVDLDQRPEHGITVLADGGHLPFADETFDVVLCLEVLEHSREPWRIVSEARRTLKRGGEVILSAPFNQPIHKEPDDYWRFTPDCLEMLLGNSFVILGQEIEGPARQPERTVLHGKKVKKGGLR